MLAYSHTQRGNPSPSLLNQRVRSIGQEGYAYPYPMDDGTSNYWTIVVFPNAKEGTVMPASR